MNKTEEIRKKKSMNYRRDYNQLSDDVKKRYEEKISFCSGIDPYSIEENELSLDPKDFPAISESDIANYMISSTSPYINLSFSAYKSTDAFKYFGAGFVLSLGSKKQKDLSILKGRVKHSQKMNETAADAWLLVNMKGKIICAHCTCTAGLSETCSHVGAICFAVSSIVQSNTKKSVTEELCKWNVPSFKEVSMSEAVGITWNSNFRKQKTSDTNFLSYCDSLTHLSDEAIYQFIEKCNADGDTTAIETVLFPGRVKRQTNIRDVIFLASLYDQNYRNKTHDELVEIGKTIRLNITNDEVKEISHSTLPYLKAKCSLGLRRGRITGALFKSCCIASIEHPPITTIRQIIDPPNLSNVPNIKYQTKYKKAALDQYKSVAIFEHVEFTYNKCGLIVNPKIPYFAGSNDGLLYCTCHGNGCLEIKCFKILESNSSFDLLTRKPNHILNKQENNLYVLEKSHDLYYQLQLQINLISLDYCDLVIWSPKEFLLLTVQPDAEFWQTTMQKALTFHEQIVMPELLGKFYTKGSETNTEETEEKLLKLEIELLCDQKNDELGASDMLAYELPCSTEHEKCGKKKSTKKSTPKSHITFTKLDKVTVRNLKNYSIEEILLTFSDHEDPLKRLYGEQITQLKRHYRQKGLPYMIALDIVTEQQFEAMVDFAEKKLVRDLEEEHNSSDVIFDAILQEWAILAFCKKFNLTRVEAIQVLQLQSQALNNSDSDI